MMFIDVQEFFKSWGLYPSEEDTSPYNKDTIDNGINEPCFDRMMERAAMHGEGFPRFCSRMIDATDNAFYLRRRTWQELEEAWNNRRAHER